MKKPWLLVAWLLVIELLAILLLIPGDWTDRAIKRESELVEQSLGVEARDWIQN
ncbi:conjugal transfer protein, partial [Escherichia coli]